MFEVTFVALGSFVSFTGTLKLVVLESEHKPSWSHGCDAHSSLSSPHEGPSQPPGQAHENALGVVVHELCIKQPGERGGGSGVRREVG